MRHLHRVSLKREIGLAFDLAAKERQLEEQVAERTAELVNAAREWRAAFDSTDDLMLMIDSDGRVVKVNLATALFSGKDPRQPRRHAGRRRCCSAPGSTGRGRPLATVQRTGKRAAAEIRHDSSGALVSRDRRTDPAGAGAGGGRRPHAARHLRHEGHGAGGRGGARRLGGDLRQHPGGHHHPRRELRRAARERGGAAAARLRGRRARGGEVPRAFPRPGRPDRRLPRLRDPPLRRADDRRPVRAAPRPLPGDHDPAARRRRHHPRRARHLGAQAGDGRAQPRRRAAPGHPRARALRRLHRERGVPRRVRQRGDDRDLGLPARAVRGRLPRRLPRLRRARHGPPRPGGARGGALPARPRRVPLPRRQAHRRAVHRHPDRRGRAAQGRRVRRGRDLPRERRGGAPPPQRAAAAGPEDGVHRHARVGDRPRLQQHPARGDRPHRRGRRAAPRGPHGAPRARGGDRRRRARLRARAAAAGVRPQAGAADAPRRPAPARRGDAGDARPRDPEEDRRHRARRRRPVPRWSPTRCRSARC